MTRAQCAGLPSVDDDAAMEQHDLVADGPREVEVLGREQHAASTAGERRNGLAEHDDRLRVECRGCLVDEDEGRGERECGDRARLATKPSRERPEQLVAAIAEAERGREHVGPARRALVCAPEGVDESDQLRHRQLVEARGLVRDERGGGAGRAGARRSPGDQDRPLHRPGAGPPQRGEASSCPSRSARRARRRRRRRRRGRRLRAPPPRRSACRRPVPTSAARAEPTGGRPVAALPSVAYLAATADNLEPRPAERDLGTAAVVAAPRRPGERDGVGEADDDDPPDDVLGLGRLAGEGERRWPRTGPRARVLCPCSLLRMR